jgi:hypothetical protein
VVWRVPFEPLGVPNTPWVALACKRHMSFTQPYVFRKTTPALDDSPTRARRGSKSGPNDVFRSDPGGHAR